MKINPNLPSDWKDLQAQAARIFEDCGFDAYVEEEIETARSTAVADVYAIDATRSLDTRYICECKLWSRKVTKAEVRTFRTIVEDHGVARGFFISAEGYQEGAYEVAQHSNVSLLTWDEFEDLFRDQWMEAHFKPTLLESVSRLRTYHGPTDAPEFERLPELMGRNHAIFREYRECGLYDSLLEYVLTMCGPVGGPDHVFETLPFTDTAMEFWRGAAMPEAVVRVGSRRELLKNLVDHIATATAKYDLLFGIEPNGDTP